jgi:nanoRNase/pAp phosphatase (c-di-AMP/oligoRNAs hydrolase)
MDGLVCGILLKELGLIDRFAFVHPKDIESGKAEIKDDDITAGLPYKESAYLAFDHYPGAVPKEKEKNLIVNSGMPSTSRVIYNYYGRKNFPGISEDMLQAVDKGFSARISIDEILYPTGWMLLNYLIDQRTGLERYKKFASSHAELIVKLADFCKGRTIVEILDMPDVEERLNLYFSCVEQCRAQILRCSSVHYNLVVTDMRKEPVIYPGNRFMIYALFPECNVSLQAMTTPDGGSALFVVGKSIIDRTYSADIGRIMRRHGGGGHSNAGTCQAKNEDADKVMESLISELKYGLLKNLFLGYFNYYQP